jgi:F-type H+-transporting ATPase subunit O
MENLAAVFKRDPKLNKILHSPALSHADKESIVGEIQKHAGGSSDVLKNFLETLVANNRLGVLEGVSEKFAQLMGAHRGEVELTVTSAAVCHALRYS